MAKKILVVEDVSFLQNAIKMVLEDAGYDVLTASDGLAGLNAATTKKPDLILLDIMMPKMDGMTMLKKLRQHPAGKRVPVIILTNLSSEEKLIEANKEGVTDYFIKSDWEIEELPDLVANKLG
ncbi:response regulator [Candidatus Parcubacteria bacterium]|nr:response regulator [Candidatus Parcubacteria bacterium]